MNGWEATELKKHITTPGGEPIGDMSVLRCFDKWEWSVITDDDMDSGIASSDKLAMNEAEKAMGRMLAERELKRLEAD